MAQLVKSPRAFPSLGGTFLDHFPEKIANGMSWIISYIWVNYNDLTTTSLGIMVSKGNHPQMGLIQVSEIL